MSSESPAYVLVCVTDPANCRRLILEGNAIAQKYQVPVKVVTVLRPALVSTKTAEVLQTFYNIAGRFGADMTVYFNDAPALTVAVHARQTNAIHIVSGAPGAQSSGFIETIKGLLPDLPMTVVEDDQKMLIFPAFPEAVASTEGNGATETAG